MEFNNFQEIQAKIIAKAWKDPAFKEKLMKNPHETFKDFGISIPENVDVTVMEEKKRELHIVIPQPPVDIESLSDSDLVSLRAATLSDIFCLMQSYGQC